jgi:uncharacterized protein (TIRG00374 family)
VLITIVEFGSRFSMWHVLLNGLESTDFRTAVRIDLVIKFINHVIPSKAAGHSVAPIVVRHYTGIEWTDAVSVAGINTGLYAVLYGVVALLGVGLFATSLDPGVAVIILLSTGLYLIAGIVVLLAGRRLELAGQFLGRLEQLLRRIPSIGVRLSSVVGGFPTFTTESAAVFRDLSSRPSVVIPYAVGWTGTLMICPGLRVWLLLTEFGGTFSPILLPIVLVMGYSVTILPLTPGGIGIAEASATLVLVSFGIAPETAGIVVLVDRTLGVYLPALLGWIPVASIDVGEVLQRDSNES